MKLNENEINSLATEKITKLLFKFSIPCVISLLVSALYNIVDQIFIGQGVGYLGNAATNVVCPLTFIALGIAICIGDGSSALFSLNQGKGQGDNSHKVVGNAIVVSLIFSVMLVVICLSFTPSILQLFGSTSLIYDYCKDYMFYIVLGLPFFMLTNTMNPLIRSDGAPLYALLTMILGALINIILDPIAIFILGWGVKGAAIATVIGQFASCIMSIIYFLKPNNYQLKKNSFFPDIKLILKELLLGLTSFLTQVAITIIMAVMNKVLVRCGANSKYGSEIPLSVIGIVMKVFQIVISIVIGITVGAQPIVGYNFGAKNYSRVRKTFWLIMLLVFLVCGIGFIFFECFPQLIISIFGEENELYNEFARLCFRIYLSSIILCGLLKSIGVFLQIMGKPIQSIALSLCRDLIFMIPLVYLLEKTKGIEGVLWSAPISDLLSFIISAIVMILVLNKLKKLDLQNQNS